MGYRAVCFDLDRTLCRSTQDPDALLERAFERAEVDPFCTHEDLQSAVPAVTDAETDREFYAALFEAVADRRMGDGADEGGRSSGVDGDVHSSGVDAAALADAYVAEYDPRAVEPVPGAIEALEWAGERGGVGLITNGERSTQRPKLEALGIADHFDVRVFCDPANGIHPKPDPAPFTIAVEDLGVDPTAVLHVGDSLRADVAGANAMGMDSAWIPPSGEPGDVGALPETPTHVFSTPVDVRAVF